jgi:membrane dipeptidase
VRSIESYMECVEYCIELMGVDHVGCGPDTLYGAHQELYGVWFPLRMGITRDPAQAEKPFPVPEGVVDPGYVKGLENPSEYVNIARWMIVNGYSDEDTQNVVGQNALRVLGEVLV